MSHPINSEIYDKILNDEGFINDVWNKFDQTTKIEILTKAGCSLLQEYSLVYGSAEELEGREMDNKNEDSNFEREQ